MARIWEGPEGQVSLAITRPLVEVGGKMNIYHARQNGRHIHMCDGIKSLRQPSPMWSLRCDKVQWGGNRAQTA